MKDTTDHDDAKDDIKEDENRSEGKGLKRGAKLNKEYLNRKETSSFSGYQTESWSN